MSEPHSIITRLRLIIEEMYKASEEWRPTDCAKLKAEAEALLPIALVDDVQVILLREAANIIDGLANIPEHFRLADGVRSFADGMTEDG